MQIRNRIRELRLVRAGDLKSNPKNWRTHPPLQRKALAAVLADVGYADALLVRETPEGLVLIDGHLRAEVTPDAEVPVLVLDVTEQEADKILLTLDPLAGMAEADAAQLESLLGTVQFEDESLIKMLAELAEQHDLAPLHDEDADQEEPSTIDERWCVVVECTDEADQKAFYEQTKQEGRSCRLLTL
jgi:hypothetical protein